MKHCYIFDFEDSQIYHVELPDRLETNEQIMTMLRRNYDFKESQISYMITEHERSIINI